MHVLTQTTLDESTLIKTSRDSYIFTCPLCDLQRRYAYSFDDKIEVFCNGEDFGTKFLIDGEIIEERDFYDLKEIFVDGDAVDPTLLKAEHLERIEELKSAGLVEGFEIKNKKVKE